MVLPDYYDYINILAFKHLYKYENKKSISIEALHKFRSELIKDIIQHYKEQPWWMRAKIKREDDDELSFDDEFNDDGFSYEDEFDDDELDDDELSFEGIDENKKLIKFINKYKDFFYMENQQVILKDHISYAELLSLKSTLEKEQKIPYIVDSAEYVPELKKILNIHTINKVIKDYLQMEQQLEEKYSQLYTKNDNDQLRKNIEKLLNIRATFYIRLSTLPLQILDAFRISSLDSDCDTPDYEHSPINMALWTQSDYYDEENFTSDLDDRIYDIYQFAIFGKPINILANKKLSEDLDQNIVGDEKTPFTFDFDPLKEEWIFHLVYLDKLNKYMAKYGKEESLLSAKRRLLYALDRPDKKIFKEENYKQELEDLNLSEIDEDSFEFFQDEYLFLADEVFEKDQDENTVKKLLLLSTYYDLTKNEEIVEIIDEHKHHEAYNAYYQIVFGEEKGKIKEKK